MHFCSITFSSVLIIAHDLIPAYIISSIVCISGSVSVCWWLGIAPQYHVER